MSFIKSGLAAISTLALAACGGAPDPSGDLEIVEDVSEIRVGDVINLKWNAENTDRVYIGLSADGAEDIMLSQNGFAATGTREFQIEPGAISFDGDDDVDVTFKLYARDNDNDDDGIEYDKLDEVRLEVKREAP